jgi:hypothetical protein
MSAPFGDTTTPVPIGLRTDEFVLRPITADDAALDHDALMETREDLRVWEQSSWPADDFSVDANREDLAGMETRHREHRAFSYTVLDPGAATCLGCVYVFPPTATFLTRSAVTPLDAAFGAWADIDAVVYFWVRRSRAEAGLDGRLLGALRDWLAGEWGFARTVFVTNERFTQQVELLRDAGLRARYEVREPEKSGTYVAFG